MRESRTSGSVRGARGNSRPYRYQFLLQCMEPGIGTLRPKPMPRNVRIRRTRHNSQKVDSLATGFSHDQGQLGYKHCRMHCKITDCLIDYLGSGWAGSMILCQHRHLINGTEWVP